MSATFIADLFALFVNSSTYLSISHRIYNFEGENMNKLIILTISFDVQWLECQKTGSRYPVCRFFGLLLCATIYELTVLFIIIMEEEV